MLVLERQRFPRWSIGESLLPHCMDFVAEAGMLEAIDAAGFQFKNGAAFARGDFYSDIDFGDKFSPGRDSTYQVPRDAFDKLLADEAAAQGVEIRYEVEIAAVDVAARRPRVVARSADGDTREIEADFVLDASGFGRTLPRLLGLEKPSAFPVRHALATQVVDGIPEGTLDRSKIRVTIHPLHSDVWFWLIPLSAERCSLGVVARPEFLAAYAGTPEDKLRQMLGEDAVLSALLARADWDTPVRALGGYSADVHAMHGRGFALLGNAAEFLDPVFSSGITIAMRSASMAAEVLDRQLSGERVDWEHEFARPLRQGVNTFRAYVDAWYDGRFMDIVLSPRRPPDICRMLNSILAGYAWDPENPYATDPQRRLTVLAQICRAA